MFASDLHAPRAFWTRQIFFLCTSSPVHERRIGLWEGRRMCELQGSSVHCRPHLKLLNPPRVPGCCHRRLFCTTEAWVLLARKQAGQAWGGASTHALCAPEDLSFCPAFEKLRNGLKFVGDRYWQGKLRSSKTWRGEVRLASHNAKGRKHCARRSD